MTAHTTIKEDELFKSLEDLQRLSAGMLVIAERVPERLTMSHALFFPIAGALDVAGHDAICAAARSSEVAGMR